MSWLNRLQETCHTSLDESFSPWRVTLEMQGSNWSSKRVAISSEELSPSEELFTAVVLGQDNDTAATCFVFIPPANLITDKFSCRRIFMPGQIHAFAKTCKIENKKQKISFVI